MTGYYHGNRVPCCIPLCKRSRRARVDDYEGVEWICGKHWKLVPRDSKREFRIVCRRIRKIVRRKPEAREHWRLPGGAPQRIRFVTMWKRHDNMWERLKREAFERSTGIG